MKKLWKTPGKKALTLIELLVVIAIITLLMSILMPALSKVKAQAKAATATKKHQCSTQSRRL